MEDFLTEERMALLIPIISIIAVGVIVLTAVVLGYARRRRFFELYHQEQMAAIEKGVSVPPIPEALLLRGRRAPGTPGAVLLKGLIWLFVGIGFFFAAHEHYSRAAMFGLIPMGVGMAYLIYYFAEGRKAPATPPDDHGSHPSLEAVAEAKP
jgi:hypothetical protein